MKKPGISIEEAHRNVRSRVLAESGDKQTPWDSSSLTGAVVLASKAAQPAPAPLPVAVAPAAPAQTASDNSAEIVFWESIKDSSDAGEYEAYLQQYPQGSFAPLAKAKIAKLAAAPAPGQPATEQAAVAPSTLPAETDDPNHVSPLPDGTIVLTDRVSGLVRGYLEQRKGDAWTPAFFYVSLDGRSGGSANCKKEQCGSRVNNPVDGKRAGQALALERCQSGAKTECVMLFHYNNAKRNYKTEN